MDARHALSDLIEYLESKRNSAIMASSKPSLQQERDKAEADAYDDALSQALRYLHMTKAR